MSTFWNFFGGLEKMLARGAGNFKIFAFLLSNF